METLKKLFIPLIFLLLVNCGGSSSETSPESSGGVNVPSSEITVHMDLPAAFVSEGLVSRILLRVTAPDIATPITVQATPPFSPSTPFSITVPIGTGRLFEVFAFMTSLDNHSAFYGKTSSSVTSASLSLPISMNYLNRAQDAAGAGDVVFPSSHQSPDIDVVAIFRTTSPPSGCPADSVVTVINLTSTYVRPTSTAESLVTIIEFDTDNDATSGSITTHIQSVLTSTGSSLTTTFTHGSEMLFTIDGPSGGTGDVSTIHVSVTSPATGATLTGFTTSNASYNDTLKRLTICVSSSAFLAQDPDGVGRFNVLTGDSVSTLVPNDIAYQNGTILYDLNFDSSSFP